MSPTRVLRETLLFQYAQHLKGHAIDLRGGTFGTPQSPALANDYLRYIAGPNAPYIPANAADWAGTAAGEILSGYHDPEPDPQLRPWATWTPGPYTRGRRARPRHRTENWEPTPGAIVVFDSISDPYGTLGIYTNHTRADLPLNDTWTVYTQGPWLFTEMSLPALRNMPLGWWTVTDHRLLSEHQYKHNKG